MTAMTNAGTLNVARTLDDRYELISRIGEGGMGIVYLARDVVRSIDVAVKVLRAEYAGMPQIARMFEREASLSARMLSPHVVKVLARTTTQAGLPCIVYEYLEGESLATRIERENARHRFVQPRLHLADRERLAGVAAHPAGRIEPLIAVFGAAVVNSVPDRPPFIDLAIGHRVVRVRVIAGRRLAVEIRH